MDGQTALIKLVYSLVTEQLYEYIECEVEGSASAIPSKVYSIHLMRRWERLGLVEEYLEGDW